MFKNLKPITPSTRHSFILTKTVSKKPLLKNKLTIKTKAFGKNEEGHIVNRHKERGAKKRYRIIDFIRTKKSTGVVCTIEHDPFRSAFIMSVFDTLTKSFFYSLAPDGTRVGDSVGSGKKVLVKLGNATFLKRIPAGAVVSNVSLKPGGKGQLARSAGSYCFLRGHSLGYCFLELMSGETRLVSSSNNALIGRMSNPNHFLQQSGKAGRSRWLGKRPTTRGVAMNPVDHPNGGGEGKKSGQRKTPWGKPSTRGRIRKSRPNNFIIKKRYESV